MIKTIGDLKRAINDLPDDAVPLVQWVDGTGQLHRSRFRVFAADWQDTGNKEYLTDAAKKEIQRDFLKKFSFRKVGNGIVIIEPTNS